MKLTVLISCMNQTDCSIVERSRVETDAVVVNQCGEDRVEEYDFTNRKGETCHVKFISTTERGLSRSRNMAIQNAEGADVCLICDDDEQLAEGYEDAILSAYEKNPDYTAISFALIRKGHTYPTTEADLNLIRILRTSSVQITFRRKDIMERQIWFDVCMGSGTGNGGGEENMFMMNMKRCGLKMKYVPETIARILSDDSQWNKGYDERFFRNNGWSTHRILGFWLGLAYMFYWCIFRRKEYIHQLSVFKALKAWNHGFWERRDSNP